MLSGFRTLRLIAAGEAGEDDDLRTIFSDDYVPLANDSDSGNNGTIERLFHCAQRGA